MLSCARMSSQSYIRKPGLTLTWGSLGIFKTPSDSMKEVWHMKRKKEVKSSTGTQWNNRMGVVRKGKSLESYGKECVTIKYVIVLI